MKHDRFLRIELGTDLLEKDKELDKARRRLPPAEQMSDQVPGSDNGRTALLEAQLAEKEGLVREQAAKLAALQQELEQAHDRVAEAAQEIELLRRESAEILAELEGINASMGWKLVKRYRRLKDHFLAPGSLGRRFYDRWLFRLKGKPPAPIFRSAGQRNPRKPVEAVYASGNELSNARSLELRRCSIIVPVLNRAKFTTACLLAIEKSVSAERIPYEVIVVDNGSTDETPDILSSWSHSRANARVLRFGENFGFARACNEGARAAGGHDLVFLNNDTLPTPGWLEKMTCLAQEDSQIGIVGSKLLFPNGRLQHIGVAFNEKKNPRHIYKGFPADISPAKVSREYQAVTGACLLMKRELYWSVGGMDERYENSYEDIDLCLKVRARGYRVLVCADSVVYHFEGISEGRRAADFRNLALFKARWENKIDWDDNRWNELDNLRDESAGFEAQEGHDATQESRLENLWERVYSCSFPTGELASIREGGRSAKI